MNKWSGGIAEWSIDNVYYLSVAFTWKLDEAFARARFAKTQGMTVKIGGPAVFLNQMKHRVFDVAEIGGDFPDAVIKHNPFATFASRGCPVGCWFCIVPAMEGREFTLIPEFTVRPILCDNNLSALPDDYQDHIISRYKSAGVKLLDANSGFEPRTFTPPVYARWKSLINAGGGPWRFAYDDMQERPEALQVMEMLSDEPQRRKRVYTLIGNEPFADCMQRIRETIDNGCEPFAQPVLKLNSLDRRPWVRFDWSEQLLRDVARWTNGWIWKKVRFSDYSRNRKKSFYCETQTALFEKDAMKSD
jgi:hypothetical protein